jgi:hypothetical protein
MRKPEGSAWYRGRAASVSGSQNTMKFPRRHFIKLAAGACGAPSLSFRCPLGQAA